MFLATANTATVISDADRHVGIEAPRADYVVRVNEDGTTTLMVDDVYMGISAGFLWVGDIVLGAIEGENEERKVVLVETYGEDHKMIGTVPVGDEWQVDLLFRIVPNTSVLRKKRNA